MKRSAILLFIATFLPFLQGCSNSVSNDHYSITLVSAQTGRGGTTVRVKLEKKSSGGTMPDFYQTKMILPEEAVVPGKGSYRPREVSETFNLKEGKNSVDQVTELNFQKISKHFYLKFPEFPQMEIKINEYSK